MSLPKFHAFMKPVLELAGQQGLCSINDAVEATATHFNLSDAERSERIPKRSQTRLYSRVTWAITYLTKAKLLEKPERGKFRITDRGRKVLEENPHAISIKYLDQFEEFVEFRNKKNSSPSEPSSGESESDDTTPAERLETAFVEIKNALADDLLERIRSNTPEFFEHLVVRVLVAMGYGGGNSDWATVTQLSGDGGIDGVIQEDRLGLDMIYVQAKKWDLTNPVGPGEIDKFVGSLMRKRATKGVFITSGVFTSGAHKAAEQATVSVRLIDGDELADLMIDFGVAVSEEETYIVKKIDSDFFDDLLS